MSANKTKQPISAQATKSASAKAAAETGSAASFTIPYPILCLALVAFVVYYPTFSFGLTELDDSIFIREFHQYNEDLGNLVKSFGHGLFDAVKDPYYRPLFMDSVILNYQISDQGQNITSFHVVNVLFHVCSVILLYKLYLKLNIKQVAAFILSLLFAVLPVLTQDVSWIPGRNDTLLAIFVFSFLLSAIDYSNSGKPGSLALSALMLLLAYFTKETAVFAAPVAFVLLVVVLQKNWRDKNNLVQYGTWAACFVLWYAVRKMATVQTNGISAGQIATDFVHRLPIIIQYLGKIFLPVNLSVFPIQEDTVYYYGAIAIVLLATAIFFNKEKNMRMVWGGLAVFLLFLLPALIVPQSLNEQTFEHRLYLPVIGILLILPQTVLLNNKLNAKQLMGAAGAVCLLLAVVNVAHQRNFKDPKAFWSQAAATSPHSAYANMMYAARLDNSQFEESCALFRKAYKLNPKEKYLNFYYGVMLQKKDSVLASEPYLLAEKNGSNYVECDFYLARVAMEKKDPNGAIAYLETFLKRAPGNPMANNNLLLLYMDTRQIDKAKAHAKHMREEGMPVPAEFAKQLGI